MQYRGSRGRSTNFALRQLAVIGYDPSSIEFCQTLGLGYVSCSPFRVPVARLAAAQAALRST